MLPKGRHVHDLGVEEREPTADVDVAACARAVESTELRQIVMVEVVRLLDDDPAVEVVEV